MHMTIEWHGNITTKEMFMVIHDMHVSSGSKYPIWPWEICVTLKRHNFNLHDR